MVVQEWDCFTCGKHIRIERHDDESAFIVATHGEGEARLTISRDAAIRALDSAYAGKRISVWLHDVHQYEQGQRHG